MKKTTTTKSSNNRIVKLLMILGLGVLMMSGCSQVNDMVNGNKATNSNTTANTNATASSNTTANSNVDSNTTVNSNANSSLAANINANDDSPVSNKSADNTSKTEKVKLEMPSNEKLQAMAKEIMLDFNDAVQQEDFTNFRNKVSKPWQYKQSAEKFKTGFESFFITKEKIFLQKNTDLFKNIDAAFTGVPNISQKYGYDWLEVDGIYQTSLGENKFTMGFIPEGKEWKLANLTVRNVGR